MDMVYVIKRLDVCTDTYEGWEHETIIGVVSSKEKAEAHLYALAEEYRQAYTRYDEETDEEETDYGEESVDEHSITFDEGCFYTKFSYEEFKLDGVCS